MCCLWWLWGGVCGGRPGGDAEGGQTALKRGARRRAFREIAGRWGRLLGRKVLFAWIRLIFFHNTHSFRIRPSFSKR